MLQSLIDQFTADETVLAVAVLVFLDVLLGVSAALKAGTFRFSYLVDFLRNDILGKAIPYFGVWAAVRIGGDFEIGGYGAIEEIVGAAVAVSLTASILKSLRDLGFLPASTSDAVAGPDPTTPLS